MAKPRVFVSSTYYDLKHIRNNVESFIDSMGYDSVLFESGDIPFRHDQPLDESCYSEINSSHMLVLIIGGRYGSKASDDNKLTAKNVDKVYEQYNSITRKEYHAARDRDIPVFIFVDSNVLAEYQTFKVNRNNNLVKYAHVDSVNIFLLLDEIISQKRNNFVRGFDNFDDIASWLRDQWAGLFADFLARNSQETSLRTLTSQIADLSGISSALKEYTESILRSVVPDMSVNIISKQDKILSNTRLKRFSTEPMINYLFEDGIPRPTLEDLFHALQESSTLEDFLKKSKLSDDFINLMLKEHESAARRDFREIRERYLALEEFEEIGPTKVRPQRDQPLTRDKSKKPKEN